MIRYFYNGLKIGKQLYKGHWSFQEEWQLGSGKVIPTQLTFYARSYRPLPNEVREVFQVQNGTDIYTDYHETDRFRVLPDHPAFQECFRVYLIQERRKAKMIRRRCEKHEWETTEADAMDAKIAELEAEWLTVETV